MEIEAQVSIHTDNLLEGLRWEEHADVIRFILDIDDRICELSFTVALRDALNLIIEEEGPDVDHVSPQE